MSSVNYVKVNIDGLPYPHFLAGEAVAGGQVPIVPSLHENPDLVTGMMYRDMPVPEMLPGFVDALKILDPKSKRRISGALGEAGGGKSYQGKLLARLWSTVNVPVFDCAGKDLGSLISETVIDEGGESVMQLLEAKDLEPTTIFALKKIFSDDELNVFGSRIVFNRYKLTERLAKNGLDIKAMIKQLSDLATDEGIHLTSSGDLKFKTVEGAVLRKGGKLLDEITSGRPGTGKILNMLLEVYTGQTAEHTVELTPTKKVTIRNQDLEPGDWIYVTGNLANDGLGTHTLDQSLVRRIRPMIVGQASVQARAQRICQWLTGLPISTLLLFVDAKYSADPVAEVDRKEFAEKLREARTKGLTYEQVLNIPAHEFTFIENWPTIAKAARKEAEFGDLREKVSNPKRAMNDRNLPSGVLEEIDDDYRKLACIDLTLEQQLIEAALSLPIGDDTDVEKFFGSRWSAAILQSVYDLTVPFGKTEIYDYLKGQAGNYGIAVPKFVQARLAPQGSLEKLMNCESVGNPYNKLNEISAEIKDLLKKDYPGLPDDLVTPAKINKALEKLRAAKKTEGAQINIPAIVENSDDFIGSSMIVDSSSENQLKIPTEKIIDHRSFALAVAIPELNPDFKVEQLFNGDFGSEEEFCKVAEGKSKTGLGTTTLACRDAESDKVVDIQIITNSKLTSEHTLIVGPKLDDKTIKMLKKREIIYICRGDKKASEKIKAVLDKIATGANMELVENAFLVRNKAPENTSVPDMLAGKSECELPNYVTNIRSREELTQLSKILEFNAAPSKSKALGAA